MKIGGNDRIVGMKVRCQVVKNRMGPPLRSTDFEIYFDRGIDNYGSWLKVMKDENLVKQAGAWYTYTDTETGEEHKFQSKDFILMMTENLELRDQIYKKICESQNHFYKIYPKDVLLDSFEKIEIRLNLVKSVSQYFFDYEWTESNLILKSQLFKGKHQPLDKPQLNLLAIYLDDIHSKDIFHGDIHVRNIFIHNDKPILVDLELDKQQIGVGGSDKLQTFKFTVNFVCKLQILQMLLFPSEKEL